MRRLRGRLTHGLVRAIARFREEPGQVLVVLTGAMTALLLFTGLVLDSAIILEERRQIQNGVDAAALAAARAARDNPAQAVAVAEQYLLLNGIDPTDPATTVTINTLYGTDQVEISVTTSVPTAFFRVANINSKDVSVRAVGQALPLGAGGYAMVALSETACDAFLAFGNPTLNISGGGIMVNSDCPSYSANIYGNAEINAQAVDYYNQGAALVSGNAVTNPAPSPVNTQVTDPLAGALPTPSLATTSPDSGGTEAAPAVRTVNGNGNVVLQPGVYWGASTSSGTPTSPSRPVSTSWPRATSNPGATAPSLEPAS